MKTIYIPALAVLLTFFSQLTSFSQISQGGFPRSFQKKIPFVDAPTVQMDPVDVAVLRAEDAERLKLGKEFDRRFGYTFDAALNLDNSGIWTLLPNGDRVWRLAIESKGALSINLTFSKFKLAPGADLFIVGNGNMDVIGALTAFNNQADELLGTTLVRGERSYLEYFEPASVARQTKLEIGKITHGYKDVFAITGFGESGSCNRNVNCVEGGLWQNEKRAAARIINNGDHCSGALINNTLENGKPYFLTANHCYENSISTWVFAFNWEAVGCPNPSSSPPMPQTVAGSSLVARTAKSDFCLLLLNTIPPPSYKPYYAGWNNVNKAPRQSVIIHHPSGDIKKITFDNDSSTSTGYIGANDSSHWNTSNYESGTTEGGSSGSPQFDQDHYIVGQLHGGQASCSNNTYDRYGKVSMSWNEGTTPATRLRDWLDPLNSGITHLSGFDPACVKQLVRLPWQENLDTISLALPKLWRVKNANGDSTFRKVSGGYENLTGQAIRLIAENFDPAGRGDSLLLSPMAVSTYKNLTIKWNQAYRRKDKSLTDTLHLMISKNCGGTFQHLASWADTSLVTDTNTFASGPFFPADTLQWKKMEFHLDSTYSRAESIVIAYGFKSGNAGTLWLDNFTLIGDTAKNKPTAAFTTDKVTGCPGTQIQFSNTSTDQATQWLWTFEGGTPTSSTEEFPLITYQEPGTYKVKLVASNPEGSDSLLQDNAIQVFSIGISATPLLQDFANTSDFPPEGYVLLNPENDVSWVISPSATAPASPGGSLMFDNFSNPNVTGTEDLLVFPQISTLGKSHLRLSFKRAYKYYQSNGSPAPDTLTIDFTKECGGNLHTLWKKGGLQLATGGNSQAIYTPQAADWTSVNLDLDSLLAYPEISLVIKNLFGFGNRVFLDDILIDTTALVAISKKEVISPIEVIPNPTQGKVVLKASKGEDFQLVSIYNSIGKEVGSEVPRRNENGSIELNFGNLPSGAYSIKLISPTRVYIAKVLKN